MGKRDKRRKKLKRAKRRIVQMEPPQLKPRARRIEQRTDVLGNCVSCGQPSGGISFEGLCTACYHGLDRGDYQ